MSFCRMQINCMFSRFSFSTVKEFNRDRPPISSRFQNSLGYFALSTPIQCLTKNFSTDFNRKVVNETQRKNALSKSQDEKNVSEKRNYFVQETLSSLYKARVATVLKKAFELSELCGVDVCIIWFDREGNLLKTSPENEEAKVRAVAERYSMLSEQEMNKKNTNLSGFLNKKMMDEKKEYLKKKDNKFLEKVSEFMDSLRSRFQTLQESLLLVDHQAKETTRAVSTDLSSIHPSTTTTSLSKFSILLYNHDNGAFTELANSSGFEQSSSCNQQDYCGNYLDLLLGKQQGMMMTNCNNFDIPLPFSNSFQQFDHEFMLSKLGLDSLTGSTATSYYLLCLLLLSMID